MINEIVLASTLMVSPLDYCVENHKNKVNECLNYFSEEKSLQSEVAKFILSYGASKAIDEVIEMVYKKFGPINSTWIKKKYKEAKEFVIEKDREARRLEAIESERRRRERHLRDFRNRNREGIDRKFDRLRERTEGTARAGTIV